MSNLSTRERILDSAQTLAQSRGFNAFSYADIAAELGVRKASIHYHFPSKHDLEVELLERYKAQFMAALSTFDGKPVGSVALLQHYAQLYASTLSEGRICLAGMMASDIGALPKELGPALSSFFAAQVDYLAKIFNTAKSSGELNFKGSGQSQACLFLAALQGGLLMANAMGDEAMFKRLAQTFISRLQ